MSRSWLGIRGLQPMRGNAFIVWEVGALGLDGSYIACGSFSSGTGSSHLASHEERFSAQLGPSFPLVLGSDFWPSLWNNTHC